MGLYFDHFAQRVKVTSPQTTLTIQDLVNAARNEEESLVGISNSKIIFAEGKATLSTGVQVGITATLLDNWAIEFWPGNYKAIIGGGNLVAASGDPIAYVVNGPQVVVSESAAATIVMAGGGGGSSAAETATAVWSAAASANNISGTMGAKVNSGPSTVGGTDVSVIGDNIITGDETASVIATMADSELTLVVEIPVVVADADTSMVITQPDTTTTGDPDSTIGN